MQQTITCLVMCEICYLIWCGPIKLSCLHLRMTTLGLCSASSGVVLENSHKMSKKQPRNYCYIFILGLFSKRLLGWELSDFFSDV